MGSLGEWRQPVKDSVEPSPQYLASMRVLTEMSLRVAFWQLLELSTYSVMQLRSWQTEPLAQLFIQAPQCCVLLSRRTPVGAGERADDAAAVAADAKAR